ncbi:MerR family transcriptional regulator [Alkalibaculum sp. M08DMB]|uniref:MerR family transcriptional regulator n=1 Tax=Alkalibaculum sporogenes TaxID=2655001 RepID=A0A6A7KC62_9FIRM|nr:MerR family transcriptional regulator [Alkalibaculum sporogenes]MPW26942.1 MerR family transcriptional regulator [Alkalibaculum sporogenes]
MLSIGEFSNICRVSTKTLRYYAEIGLILPNEINPENGYRYYSIKQLETMLFINRLKSYKFSLEEIKTILKSEELQDEKLYVELVRKKHEIKKQVQEFKSTLDQINEDISILNQGKSIMSYLDSIDVQLVEVPMMYILSIRKMVYEHEFPEQYGNCFRKLFKRIQEDKLP